MPKYKHYPPSIALILTEDDTIHEHYRTENPPARGRGDKNAKLLPSQCNSGQYPRRTPCYLLPNTKFHTTLVVTPSKLSFVTDFHTFHNSFFRKS